MHGLLFKTPSRLDNARQSILFIVKTLGDLYIIAFLLRFLLQWVRADFYNPLAQVVVKVTDPLIRPARRIIPSLRSLDLPTLAVLLLLEGALIWAILAIVSFSAPVGTFAVWTVLRLVRTLLSLYMFSILVSVLMSWIAPGGYHPIARVLANLNEPLLRPARRLLPPVSGLDLSPMLVAILIIATRILIPLPPLLY